VDRHAHVVRRSLPTSVSQDDVATASCAALAASRMAEVVREQAKRAICFQGAMERDLDV
jgi:hypothetical protein